MMDNNKKVYFIVYGNFKYKVLKYKVLAIFGKVTYLKISIF